MTITAGRLTPLETIRDKCRQCTESGPRDYAAIDQCIKTNCALWRWRYGVRPETAREAGRVVEASQIPAVPAEQRDTMLRACAGCGQMIIKESRKCGWCGQDTRLMKG